MKKTMFRLSLVCFLFIVFVCAYSLSSSVNMSNTLAKKSIREPDFPDSISLYVNDEECILYYNQKILDEENISLEDFINAQTAYIHETRGKKTVSSTFENLP